MVSLRLATGTVVCLLLLAPLAARNREAARRAYSKAAEYHDWLVHQPEGQRTENQYKRAIFLFRRVIDHDPTFGACDDSLFAIAGLYDEMGRHLSQDSYKQRAIYYYEFVAREYPLTRHRQAALEKAEKLRAPPAPLKPELATLSEVRYWSNEDYTRVVLQLDREVEFEKSILADPDRIYFDLQATRLTPQAVDRSYEVNGLFIKRIRVGQNRHDLVRVVLDFDRINQHTVFALYDPFRIVIDTRGLGLGEAAATKSNKKPGMKTAEATLTLEKEADNGNGPSTSGPSPTFSGDLTMTRTLGLKVGRVVIDPGHGGHDTGTIGPQGLLEKDLVLDISLKLKNLLEKMGTEVILTRSTDTFVPLEERTAIANKNGADLFISVHANASRNRRVSGVETYVLNFATNPSEREVASRENASSQRNIRELEDLLRQIALEDYNQESRDLAHAVQSRLFNATQKTQPRQKNRGVKQAPFIVLIGSNMPSILTEIGFISNPDDERYFQGQEGRSEVAKALFEGVTDYFESLGSLPAASRSSSAAAAP